MGILILVSTKPKEMCYIYFTDEATEAQGDKINFHTIT